MKLFSAIPDKTIILTTKIFRIILNKLSDPAFFFIVSLG